MRGRRPTAIGIMPAIQFEVPWRTTGDGIYNKDPVDVLGEKGRSQQ